MDKDKVLCALHRDRKYVINFCSKYNRIYLYGAGRTAELFYCYLKEEGVPVHGVIVSDGQVKSYFQQTNFFHSALKNRSSADHCIAVIYHSCLTFCRSFLRFAELD